MKTTIILTQKDLNLEPGNYGLVISEIVSNIGKFNTEYDGKSPFLFCNAVLEDGHKDHLQEYANKNNVCLLFIEGKIPDSFTIAW